MGCDLFLGFPFLAGKIKSLVFEKIERIENLHASAHFGVVSAKQGQRQ